MYSQPNDSGGWQQHLDRLDALIATRGGERLHFGDHFV